VIVEVEIQKKNKEKEWLSLGNARALEKGPTNIAC
jgi:hypothetical protein